MVVCRGCLDIFSEAGLPSHLSQNAPCRAAYTIQQQPPGLHEEFPGLFDGGPGLFDEPPEGLQNDFQGDFFGDAYMEDEFPGFDPQDAVLPGLDLEEVDDEPEDTDEDEDDDPFGYAQAFFNMSSSLMFSFTEILVQIGILCLMTILMHSMAKSHRSLWTMMYLQS